MSLTEENLKDLIAFLNTSHGQILMRIGMVVLMAEALRLLLRKFLDVVDLWTTVSKKAITVLTDFFGYLGNIAMSVLFTFAFIGRGEDWRITVAESVVYGLMAILIHWSIISGNLKKWLGFIAKHTTFWKGSSKNG